MIVRKEDIKIVDNYVTIQTITPMKVVSSAMHNPGFGYYTHLLNRSVPKTYDERKPHHELRRFLQSEGYPIDKTVAMMTAVNARFATIREFTYEGLHLVVMITAGLGNAVDITRAFHRQEQYHAGTINTWVLINGKLSDEALFQAMISTTEAKVKALLDEDITDPTTGTLATGTSTDSLLIASTEEGDFHQYAGPITMLGKVIGHGVYETMREAIQKYKKEKEANPL
ncbi:iron ABC transporter permease [Lysinibacillus sphaericus]|uniref:Iron (III) dicitrate ABC transporter ATPase n=3 Tax=Lysinibacillus TaxID=400634 RepID=A0A2S0JZU2_LYSSH|nr:MULTISPECIES: adenosylcobinamide amidohydrolase [Lysinibacillus]AHN22153.1 iron ABC transporter permease [Lysinibacillus varians]AVK96616.1 iron ABC transporter permease [Lysinibacillus sphaericus]MED4542853.1 adenosylcobinamide amidohydrolase [Lysinibacillus sphaericus]TKI19858.1 iron ABC transporter permease [Lysinibacillus sphaericus]TKI50497.1 iron ABC transporter permease [Lysinibacillus tabacifolii]